MTRTLKLVEPKAPPKPNPRAVLIDLFNKKYEAELGEENPFPFANCMKAMLHFRYVDEDTGEVFTTYPNEDAWKKELDGFFKDEFAKTNRGFHFTYFIKQFGSFAKRNRVKPKPQGFVSPWDTCPYCGTDFERGTSCPNPKCKEAR